MNSVLFVCSANQCRSPMAEALFRDTVRKRGEDDQWQIASAGVFAGDGYPATINACEVMGERGFDIRRHLSQRISRELMSNYALVLVMESDHQITLNKEYPEFADRIVLFKKIIGEESDTKDFKKKNYEHFKKSLKIVRVDGAFEPVIHLFVYISIIIWGGLC